LVLYNLSGTPWPKGKSFGFIQGYYIMSFQKILKLNCDVIKVFKEK
jgi:hypothetical protein